MTTTVYSVDGSGRRKWVADFAHEETARRFADSSNRVYAGHLTMIIDKEDS